MTKVILSLALLAQMAYAGKYVDYLKTLSWNELRMEEGIILSGDKIWFGGRQFSVLDVCLEENAIRTIEVQKIEKYDGERFILVGYDYLRIGLTRSRPVVDGEQTTDRPELVELSYSIGVNSDGDGFPDKFLFSNPYTIGKCN